MKRMDEQYLATPFYGSRRMKAWLNREGHRQGNTEAVQVIKHSF